jgi:hypothetical protein
MTAELQAALAAIADVEGALDAESQELADAHAAAGAMTLKLDQASTAHSNVRAAVVLAREAVEAAIAAVPAEPDPTEPDPTEPHPADPDLIFSVAETITAPVHGPAGGWLGMRTLLMVAQFDGAAAGYEKLAGAGSSQDSRGGFGFGRRPDGNLEGWTVGNGAFVQPTMPAVSGKASFVMWRLAEDALEIHCDDLRSSRPISAPIAELDGVTVLGAGFWRDRTGIDPLQGRILAAEGYRRTLSDEEVAAWVAVHAHLLDDAPASEPGDGGGEPQNPPTSPPDAGLEPVSGSALQVAVQIDAAARQSWHGFGWGANAFQPAIDAHSRIQANAAKLFDELNSTVIRLHNPEGRAGFVNAYKPIWDIARTRGVDTVLATGYVFRGNSTVENFADSVAYCIGAGIPITHVSVQNEPDGNPANAMPESAYVPAHRNLRQRLDALGLQQVKIIGIEWAHFGDSANREFDLLDAAGLIPGTVIAGAGHCYKDCPNPGIYDDRWMQRGCALWSTETGNSGTPNHAARFVSALNHGAAVEIAHIGQLAITNPNSEQRQQVLVLADGTRSSWHGHCRLISQALQRGTVMRLATCDRRPGQGLSDANAVRMVRTGGTMNPELNAACGLRPDGKWVLIVQNATQGSLDSPSQFLNASFAGKTIQFTAKLPTGADGTLIAQRCSTTGAISTQQSYPMLGGFVRATVAAGELIVMVGGA